MSLKMKLISTISAFILVLSFMLVGILAAKSVTLNIGGNVSFTATSVYAEITGSIVGTAEHPTGSPLSLSPIDIDYTDTETAIDLSGDNSDWTTMPLNFDENASNITVTINIHNLAQDRLIAVSLTDNTNITNVSVARKYNNATFAGNTTSQTIAEGQTGEFTFTLSLANKNNDISGEFKLALSLNNANSSSNYSATISNETNDAQKILYIKGDDGVIHEVNYGEVLTLNTSKVEFALNKSYFEISNTGINSLSSGEEIIEPYIVMYLVMLSINGIHYFNNRTFTTGDDWYWAGSGSSNCPYSENVEFLNNDLVLSITLTENMEFVLHDSTY